MNRLFSVKNFVGLLVCTFVVITAQAQVTITLGPDEVAQNQSWTITLTVQNDRIKSYDKFPDIEGFQKRGTSTQSSTNIINGQISSSQSVIMTYAPLREGTVKVPAFTMNVNGQNINSPGKSVKINPASQQRDPARGPFDRDPFDSFFGRTEPEFIDIQDDAFLALTTSKDEVYVGEGFTTTLSFYVADNNRAPLQFYELGKQLTNILKNIKPANCWEENFNIENVEGESVTVGGKNYTQYKLYQAAFYPLNTEPVSFPAVGLEMIKYKVAKNPSFFGQNRKEDFKTFYSKEKRIRIKELPPHPLKDAVAVGSYKLTERLPNADVTTGQSIAYEFVISGEGNIAAIDRPVLTKNGNFDFYEPNIRQNISRQRGRVSGTKSFNYFMVPKEPGNFRLADYYRWVFFNPETKRYDTLTPKAVVRVTGESKKNEAILANDLGSFYDRMHTTDNEIMTINNTRWQKLAMHIFIVVILGASVYLVVKK